MAGHDLKCLAISGVDHVVKLGDLKIRANNNGERQGCILSVVHSQYPSLMFLSNVGREVVGFKFSRYV